MKRNQFTIGLTGVLLAATLSTPAHAQETQTVIEICNDAGVCSAVAPEFGAVYLIIDALASELDKNHPFGESNEIMKAINELIKFLNVGMGTENDIRKFLEHTGIDHLLQQLGIKLFT